MTPTIEEFREAMDHLRKVTLLDEVRRGPVYMSPEALERFRKVATEIQGRAGLGSIRVVVVDAKLLPPCGWMFLPEEPKP